MECSDRAFGRWLLVSLVVLSTDRGTAFDVVLGSAQEWATVLAVAGIGALFVGSRRDDRRSLDAPLLLLLLMVAFLALVQYPFGIPMYYCYVAPLVVLASAGLVAYLRVGSRLIPALLLCAYAAFAILIVDRGYLVSQTRDAHTVILDSNRASIRVTPDERTEYRRVSRDCSPNTAQGVTSMPDPTHPSCTSSPIVKIRRVRCSTSWTTRIRRVARICCTPSRRTA